MVRSTRARGASSAAAAADHAAVREEKEDDATVEAADAAPSNAHDASCASGDCPVEPCVICLEDIEGTYAALDQCSHKFHPPCILHWASITNLCPLCKTRFKHIKEINPAAVVAPVRAGLRGRGAKVVRVATKNQSVEWSSSSEEEVEEEEEQPRRRVRRAAASRRVTARAPAAAPATRSTRPTAATRSTRSRSRKQSDDEEEIAEEDDDEEKKDDDEEDDEYLPNSSEVEGDATPNLEEMNDEELLAFAIKESLKITDSTGKPTTKASSSSSSTRRAPTSRRGRAAAASTSTKNDIDECKETHEEEEEEEGQKPAKKSSRSARTANARGATRRKRTLVDEEEEEEEEKSEEPSSLPTNSSSSSIQWIRTRDGRWTRTRSTGLSVDSLMAQHIAAEKAKTVTAQPSVSSSSSSSYSFLSASNSSIPPATQPKSATNAAMTQADDALSSFELRILQHKRAKESAALLTSSVLDLTDDHGTSTTHLPLNLSTSSSIASDASASLQSSSSADSSSSSFTSSSSSANPQDSEYTPSVCVPGGLNVWRRKRQSELHPNSADKISSFEEKDDNGDDEANVSRSSNDSGSLDRTMNYDRYSQEDSLPTSPQQPCEEDANDLDHPMMMIPGGISGMHVAKEDDDNNSSNKENEIDDRFEAPASSLWSRVSQFISSSLTPSKLPPAAAAKPSLSQRPQANNGSKLSEQLAVRQRQPLKDRN